LEYSKHQCKYLPNKPVPDPFWQAQGKYINLTTGTLRNKFDSITYSIPGFGTFKRYGNQVLPNSSITFHEFVFRYTVIRAFNVKLNLTDSFNHASGSSTSCTSADAINLSHGKPDAHGMNVTGKQCPGLNGGGTQGYVILNLRANSTNAGTKPSCGQTYIYINMDSLADRMDNTPYYLDGFTTWGVGTFGTPINPGPGVNATPGLLTRNTFYTGMNWNPIPPSPWAKPDGSTIVYHYGANSGTPPPADSINGYITIGLFLGSGQKDTTLQVWKSNYLLNENNDGSPLRDTAGRIFSWNPADPAGMGYPWTYQNYLLIKQTANRSTPPPTPIPNGWRDDSLAYTYSFHAIINSSAQIRYTSPSIIWDTLLTVQYIDFNNPRCISDTVWYHNFLHIKENDASMVKSPLEISVNPAIDPPSYLREREDTVWAAYQNYTQNNIKVSILQWGDFTATIDSFYNAANNVSDGYYTNGFRRVRYNLDFSSGNSIVLDSTVWPCGVYGQKQYQQLIHPYTRIFDVIGTIAPDTLILRNKFPSSTHFDKWYPYTNYHDTIHLRMRDTIKYTQFNAIDTSMMQFPVWHVYHKTSWETALNLHLPQNTISPILNFIANVQNCEYFTQQNITVGIIDTLHILHANGFDDTIFCKNESVHFIDSLRYWRYDNQLTDANLPNWGTGRPNGYHGYNYGTNEPNAGYPWDTYQFDTIDFWARDTENPLDTLINLTSILSNSQIDFKFYPNNWTNYDNQLNYLPSIGKPLTGHWDAVLRGGNVKVLLPNISSDSVYEKIYPGMVIFVPVATGIGNPGIYVWGNNGWIASFSPIKIDSLNSLTDISKTTSPVFGRTLIYNKGKGTIKKTGMYYWGGTQWIFIANNPYTTFPFFTHRVYWNFGDSSPIYQGVKPTHQYKKSGTYKVSMISRDSIGHFDTCFSFVKITDIVSKPSTANTTIECNTSAVQFFDSSYTDNSSQIKKHY
jgi:PKD domain